MAEQNPSPTDPNPQETAVQHDPTTTDRHDTAVLPGEGATTWEEPAGKEPAQARPGRRSPDLLALVAGIIFCLIAVLGLVGTSLPGWVFGGGLVAVVLVIAGAGLLVSELRRTKR